MFQQWVRYLFFRKVIFKILSTCSSQTATSKEGENLCIGLFQAWASDIHVLQFVIRVDIGDVTDIVNLQRHDFIFAMSTLLQLVVSLVFTSEYIWLNLSRDLGTNKYAEGTVLKECCIVQNATSQMTS